jgi:hypothetical protein
MKTTINIDNYEEIMFRLMEVDFDKADRADLLEQIGRDEFFKFEWASWQKTKVADPLDNYAVESHALTAKIILIAEPRLAVRKRFFYYWAAAASILLLISAVFLLTADFNKKTDQKLAQSESKSPAPVKTATAPVQNNTVAIAVAERKQARKQRIGNRAIPVVPDSNTVLPTKITLAEIPKVVDTFPVKTNDLAKVSEKKPRYTITIETSDIGANNFNNTDLAQKQKVNLKKVFTNSKMLLSRKPNGEPDKLYIIGDENSYLCININY